MRRRDLARPAPGRRRHPVVVALVVVLVVFAISLVWLVLQTL